MLTPDDINQEYNCSNLPKEAQSTMSPPGVRSKICSYKQNKEQNLLLQAKLAKKTHEAHSTWSNQGVRAKPAPSSKKGDNRNKEQYILL